MGKKASKVDKTTESKKPDSVRHDFLKEGLTVINQLIPFMKTKITEQPSHDLVKALTELLCEGRQIADELEEIEYKELRDY